MEAATSQVEGGPAEAHSKDSQGDREETTENQAYQLTAPILGVPQEMAVAGNCFFPKEDVCPSHNRTHDYLPPLVAPAPNQSLSVPLAQAHSAGSAANLLLLNHSTSLK